MCVDLDSKEKIYPSGIRFSATVVEKRHFCLILWLISNVIVICGQVLYIQYSSEKKYPITFILFFFYIC